MQSQQNAETISSLTEKIRVKMNEVTKASTNTAVKSQAQTAATNEMVQAVEEMTGLAKRIAEIASDL